METFLQMVARDLYHKTDGDLARTAVIFPNRRAGLFFNEYLAAQSDRPLWAPLYTSISDFFDQLSDLRQGDPIRLVCELYRVFCQETGSKETLDEFYFWGELLISDFDDVDKNLVDARRLFVNLQDLKDMTAGDYTFLDEEQERAIRQFFRNFSADKRTELKARFLSLWDKMGAIYTGFRQRLEHIGLAYEGMVFRRAIERLDVTALPLDRYVFVGFNALNRVEARLFSVLKEAGKALFYWDYDLFYTRLPHEQSIPFAHEAGEFILRNLKTYPNELPESAFDAMRRPKRITFIGAPTENAQARYLPHWFESVKRDERERGAEASTEKENAVVLCNEAMLLPVLHAIPSGVDNVNVTMGYPLSQTPVYSFINAVIGLHTEGYRPDTGRYAYQAVMPLLKHPYTRRLSEQAARVERQLTQDNRFYPLPSELQQDDFLQCLFTPQAGISVGQFCGYIVGLLQRAAAIYRWDGADPDEPAADASRPDEADDIYSQLYREALFQAYTVLTRLQGLANDGSLEGLSMTTLKRLLYGLLGASSIPFHGEPAIGMQIMGVLETRNLDFANLLVLSLNEGQLPKKGGEASFVPYNLRRAFGMTTVEHRNAVYAYYFYRLIQRASSITLMYNTSSEGLNRGEMSRFMLQLLVESPHPIGRFYLEAGQSPRSQRTIVVEKSSETLRRMARRFDLRQTPDAVLSPSALNAYIDCPLKFYFRYVARVKPPDEISAEIDSALFGTIFHHSAEQVYRTLTANGQAVNRDDIDRLLRDTPRLQGFVDQAFKQEFFHIAPDERAEYNGTQLINAHVIVSYLRQLLRNDLLHAPFRIEGLEHPIRETRVLDTPSGTVHIALGGTVDRMDSKDGTLRIVDYKTGGEPKTPTDVEELFTPAAGRPSYVFQAFFYSAIQCRTSPLRVAPALLYIHRAASESYTPVIEMGPPRQHVPVTDFAAYADEFRTRLDALLQELYDPSVPFTQAQEPDICTYCDFRNLCFG